MTIMSHSPCNVHAHILRAGKTGKLSVETEQYCVEVDAVETGPVD